MDQNELNINITATDDASPVMDGVAQSADQMAKTVSTASDAMAKATEDATKAIEDAYSALSESEIAIAEEAQALVDNWDAAMNGVADATASAVTSVDEDFATIAKSSEAAATSTIQSWDASLADLQKTMAMTAAETDALFAGMSKKGESSMAGMMSYFRYYMGASMSKQLAGMLNFLPGAAVTAAESGANTMQITQIQDKIASLKASIATQEASLQHSTGTSGQLAARHQAVAASVAKENTEIALLQKQLAPLQAAYDNSKVAAQQYATEIQKVTTDWQNFLSTVGTPLLENLNSTLKIVDKIIIAFTDWAKKNPETAKAIMTVLVALAGVFTVLSGILNMVAGFKIFEMILVGSFTGVGGAAEGAAVGIATMRLGVMALYGAGIMAGLFALAALIGYIKDQFDSMESSQQKAMQSAQTALNISNSSAFQKLLATSTGAEHAKLLGIQAANIAAVHSTAAQTQYDTSAGGFIANGITGLPGYLGGMIMSGVKALATGGIVTSPTLALVGEAGPEAVIPLSSFAGGTSLAGVGGGAGGSGNIVVNVTGTFMSENAGRQMANLIAKSLNRQIKLKSFA